MWRGFLRDDANRNVVKFVSHKLQRSASKLSRQATHAGNYAKRKLYFWRQVLRKFGFAIAKDEWSFFSRPPLKLLPLPSCAQHFLSAFRLGKRATHECVARYFSSSFLTADLQ